MITYSLPNPPFGNRSLCIGKSAKGFIDVELVAAFAAAFLLPKKGKAAAPRPLQHSRSLREGILFFDTKTLGASLNVCRVNEIVRKAKGCRSAVTVIITSMEIPMMIMNLCTCAEPFITYAFSIKRPTRF
mmetsp:Transcript_27950/g.43421  ORF Transcript_27950/g.43421 Transcript_27950/m.43421 type:complete len:130 (+) Transcript_27950:927-1316(+)